MSENNLMLVFDVMQALANAQIKTWLFGGWAEELLSLRLPGPHRDVDLLYLAPDFGPLDEFLQMSEGIEEIPSKHFVHKRAFLWQKVVVEVFLVQAEACGYVTDFFSLYRFWWPEDTFEHPPYAHQSSVDYALVSPSALHLYRERHQAVEHARRQYRLQRDVD